MTAFDHGDIIQIRDLDARIGYLASNDDLSDYEEEELADLKRFRKRIITHIGDGTQSLISDEYWEQYASDHAQDIYGSAATTAYWNNQRWSRDLREDYAAVKWGGVKYWGDGS